MQILSALPRSLFAAVFLAGLMAAVGLSPASAQTCDVFVDTNASGNGNGSQSNPYTDLQDGLDDAASGQVVCVAEGTYNPPKKNTAFSMPGGSMLRGGYPSEFSSTTQDVDGNPTILDGANAQKGSSAKRILELGQYNGGELVVDGVTIQNGDGNAGAGFNTSAYNGGTITFRDVIFRGNDSGNGNGGAVQISGGTVVLESVNFENNVSGGEGGALYVENGDLVQAKNSTFVANEAGGGGGAVEILNMKVLFEGVLVKGNRASGNGGGLYLKNAENQISEITNATISGNYSSGNGGGVHFEPDGELNIKNSIVWGNDAASSRGQINIDYDPQKVVISNSDVQGSGGSGAWDTSYGTDGGNNIALNPIFLTPKQPSAAPTTAGDYRLGARSPAVDAGDDSAINLSTDLDGENRIQDAAVDMGPYEGSAPLPDPEILYVDQNVDNPQGNGGTSWNDAVATLQAALDQASTNTEIWVADGVYYPDNGPNVSGGDVDASFTLKDRVSIYGGFSGGESSRSERNPDANLVVLSGDLDQDDTTNENGVVTSPSDQNSGSKNTPTNAYHVVDGSGVSSQTVVDGVTITAGSADDRKNQDGRPDEVGGGVFVNNGSPTLSDVRVIGNRAKLDGGGIASYGGGGPVISEAVIESNVSFRNGGGIYNADGSGLRVRFLTLRSNTAAESGGGIYNTNANIRFTNATIEGNVATASFGGGIYTSYSNGSILTNLRVVGNRAASGGGFYNTANGGTKTTVGTATFSGNYATNSGYPQGGAIFTENETVDLNNSVVWGNGPNQIEDQSSFNQQASLIEGGLGGALNQDPQFISDPTLASSGPTTDGNLRLQSTSPAGDAGDKTLLPSDVSDVDNDGNTTEELPLDLAGGTRVRSSEVDIGAYERSTLELTISGTDGADGTDAGWRDMGVPVEGIQVSDVKRASDRTELQNVNPSWGRGGVWKYGNGWEPLSASDPLPNGHGFSVYFKDKGASALDPNLSLMPIGGSKPGDTKVVVGDQRPLNTSAEFNFLANPYGVAYDLAEVGDFLDTDKFQGQLVQVWQVESGGYRTINLPSFIGDKTGVAPWQAFFVQRNSASDVTQVTFPKEGRSPDPSNTNPFHGSKSRSPSMRAQLVKLDLTATNSEGTLLMKDDAANVLLRPGAKEVWDPYDATKLTPPTNKYALIGPVGPGEDGDTVMKAQESRSASSSEMVEIPLGLSVKNYQGPLTLSLAETVNIEKRWTVTLVDTKGTATLSDDEEKLLTSADDSYEFTYGSGKAKGIETKARQVAPPTPDPVDWSPLNQKETKGEASSASASTSKSTPMARFKLRLERTNPLPVEMAGFDAAIDGQTARLSWKTASETNNEGFYVQHQRVASDDSTVSTEDWSAVGFVEAGGNSNQLQEYRFQTEELEYGEHAFRLRQVDSGGTAHHTEPIVVESQLRGKVAIDGPNPNPVRQNATVDLTVRSSQEVTVRLYDVLGRQVQTLERGRMKAEKTKTLQIGTAGLSSGTYFVRVVGEQFQRTKKITVVR